MKYDVGDIIIWETAPMIIIGRTDKFYRIQYLNTGTRHTYDVFNIDESTRLIQSGKR